MVVIREDSLADNIDRMHALMQANWDETGFDFPLALNTEFYKRMEAAGILLVVGAFDGDEVIGYSLASIVALPHNPSIIACNSDVLFVRKDMRGTSAGARLMLETERLAKQRGAHRMLWHARGETDFVEVLTKRGYKKADVVMMKEL